MAALSLSMTIEEILNAEKDMVMNAEARYGHYFKNAGAFNALLQHFVVHAQPEASIFLIFLSQLRKHHTLALFSTVRLHHVQAMQNLRQVLESGVHASYAIANPNQEDFVVVREGGVLDAPKRLERKRYKWLENNFSDKSEFIKNMKGSIQHVVHSNLIYAIQNFEMREDGFELNFFDSEREFFMNTNLWLIGNLALGLMDLFTTGQILTHFKIDICGRLSHPISHLHDISAQSGGA